MLTNHLIVAAILFSIGALGFLSRRNTIVMFLSAELMLQGVSLNLASFGRSWANWHGQIFAIFVLAVAAVEAAIALALVLSLFIRCKSLDISVWQELREPGQAPVVDELELESTAIEPPLSWPTLTPAGIEPVHSEEDAEETAHV